MSDDFTLNGQPFDLVRTPDMGKLVEDLEVSFAASTFGMTRAEYRAYRERNTLHGWRKRLSGIASCEPFHAVRHWQPFGFLGALPPKREPLPMPKMGDTIRIRRLANLTPGSYGDSSPA